MAGYGVGFRWEFREGGRDGRTWQETQSSASSRREALEFYLFISPWLIGLVVFLVYPLISSLYYSFTRYEIGGRPFWIGLENYVRMFADPLYLKTIRTTFIFALISVPAISMLALGLALDPGAGAQGHQRLSHHLLHAQRDADGRDFAHLVLRPAPRHRPPGGRAGSCSGSRPRAGWGTSSGRCRH